MIWGQEFAVMRSCMVRINAVRKLRRSLKQSVLHGFPAAGLDTERSRHVRFFL